METTNTKTFSPLPPSPTNYASTSVSLLSSPKESSSLQEWIKQLPTTGNEADSIMFCTELLSADEELQELEIGKFTMRNRGDSFIISVTGNPIDVCMVKQRLADFKQELRTSLQQATGTIITHVTGWRPASQSRNNYNLAALNTVVQITRTETSSSLTNSDNLYETQDEKRTRTPDGFIEVAKEVGLMDTKAVKAQSAKEYRQCIGEALQMGQPLIAPFLNNSGSLLAKTRSSDYIVDSDWRVRGQPITNLGIVKNKGYPIKALINSQKSLIDFQKLANAYIIGDRKITPQMVPALKDVEVGSTQYLEIIKSVRTTEMAVQNFKSLIDAMTEETFQALKSGSLSFEDFIISGELMHSCVITAYNPENDAITIAHWEETFTTFVGNLYASSQLLPDECKGILYTFHPN